MSSDCCIVSAAWAELEQAVPTLKYWVKIKRSSLMEPSSSSYTSFSHTGKPKTCDRSIFCQVASHLLSSPLESAGGVKRSMGGAVITACSSFSPR